MPADTVPPKGSSAVTKVDAESAKEELERILSSPVFSQSQRISRFLRFVVEEVLEKGPDQLKEYSLGVTVFDRDAAYDPRTDSIVRVEAGRVRTKLKEYYDNEGRDDRVIIDLPKGSYIPSITTREARRAGTRKLSDRGVRSGKAALVVTGSAALLCASIAVFLAYQNVVLRKELKARQGPVLTQELTTLWAPFLSPDAQTSVVFGSPFFFFSPANRLFLRPYDLRDAQGSEADPVFLGLQERFGPIIPTPSIRLRPRR